MKKSFLLLGLFSLILSSALFVSCDNDDDDNSNVTPNIVEFASEDANFSVLVEAVVKAGLDDDLAADGPFTLFAPTNTAFQNFLNAKGFASLDDVPADVLASILTNHVVAGRVASSDIATGYVSTISATSFGSNIPTSLYVSAENGNVVINKTSTVTTADVEVSNGIIHVIDVVIDLPTVVTFAVADPNFSSLVAALTAPGNTIDFVDVLSGTGPFTVFAPTNDAFQALLDSNEDWNTVGDIPTAVLEEVLLYHVTDAGNVRSTDLTDEFSVPTLANESFTIDLDANPPKINAFANSANIIATDVQATNGVIHVIDTVILPDLN